MSTSASSAASSAAIQLSGLASGIDWTSIVNELLQIESAPETQMNSQIATANQKSASYSAIGTQLTTLGADVKSLSDPNFFDSRTTSLSNSSVASATAAEATPLGNYSFHVGQLATSAVQLGSTATSEPLSSTNDVSGLVLSSAGFATPVTAGTFTVNGKTVTISTGDTLQSVFDQIYSVTGHAVTGSYDTSTDEISLNSSSPIVLGSATDTSNFLQAAELYNSGTGTISSVSALGGVDLSIAMSNANFSTPINDGGSGKGEFVINGVHISYNASTDAVNDVLQRINDSSAGVTATYDSLNDRFELTNKTTGDVGISLQDVTGNFLTATGLSGGTLQRGNNLQYTINNSGTLTSQSNTISGASAGITGLSITALSEGTTSITVGSDTSTISSAISKFVTDYNSVQNYISGQIKASTDSSGNVTAGILTGDLDAESITDRLRQLTNGAPSGLSGVIATLNDLGITSNGTDNTLSLSSTTTLNNMLSNNLDQVKQMFTDPDTGIAATLNNYISNVNGPDGVLANDESSITSQIAQINSSITALKQRISGDQTRLTNEFVAMETAINSINAQKQYLNAYFNGSSSTAQSAPSAAGSNVKG